MNIGELTATLGVDTSGLKTAEKEMRDFGKNASLYLTTPLLLAGGAAFKMASDMEESMNKVNVAFKNDAAQVQEWSKTTLNALGVSRSSSLEMVSLFGDMSTSMGLTTSKAAEMSMSMVELAADLASFKNISIETAQTSLAGVFTGETETLKRLGIVMTDVNLKTWALEQGIKKNIDTMTQAEKIQLRYNFIMAMTKNSQGDFLRTSEGAANQMRIFKESITETGVAFGQVLLPVITPVIKSTNSLLKTIAELETTQKQWIIGIAGGTAALGPLALGFSGVLTVGRKVTEMFRVMNTVIAKNPYIAAAAAIGVIATAIYKWQDATTDLQETQKELNSQIANETFSLNSLFERLKSTTKGTKEHADAIKLINDRYGNYIDNMITEKSSLEDITKAQQKATQALIANASVKAYKEQLTNEIADVSKAFDSEFKTFIEGFNKTYGADRIGEFLDALYKGAEDAIKNNTGGMSQAVNIYEKYVEKISKRTGYLKYDFEDFTKAFTKFISVKTEKSGVILQLEAMIAAYEKLIKVEEKSNETPKKNKVFDKLMYYKNTDSLSIIPSAGDTARLTHVLDTTTKIYDRAYMIDNKWVYWNSNIEKTLKPMDNTVKAVDALEQAQADAAWKSVLFWETFAEGSEKASNTLFAVADSFQELSNIVGGESAKILQDLADITGGVGNLAAGMGRLSMGDITGLPQAIAGVGMIINGLMDTESETERLNKYWNQINNRIDNVNSGLEYQLELMNLINDNAFEDAANSLITYRKELENLEKQFEAVAVSEEQGKLFEDPRSGSRVKYATVGRSLEERDRSGFFERADWSISKLAFTKDDLEVLSKMKAEGKIVDQAFVDLIDKWEQQRLKVIALEKELEKKTALANIQSQINAQNTLLLTIDENGQKAMEIQQSIVSKQAEMDIIKAQNTIENEKELQSQIALINAQATAEKEAIYQQYLDNLVGITAETLTDDIAGGVAEAMQKAANTGVSAFYDMGMKITEVVRNAIIEGLKAQMLAPAVEKFQKALAEDIKGMDTTAASESLAAMKSMFGMTDEEAAEFQSLIDNADKAGIDPEKLKTISATLRTETEAYQKMLTDALNAAGVGYSAEMGGDGASVTSEWNKTLQYKLQKQLLGEKENSAAALKIQKQLLTDQAAEQVRAARLSAQTEAEKSAQIQLIYAQRNSEMKKLDDAYAEYQQQKLDEEFKKREELLGTTASSLSDSLKQGLEDGLGYAEVFGNSLNDILKTAVINGMSMKLIEPMIKDMINAIGVAAEDEDGLTKSDISMIKMGYGQGSDFQKNLQSRYESIQEVVGGMGLNTTGNAKGLQGAIKGMSEETAGLIAGQFNGLRMTSIQIEKNTFTLHEIRDLLKEGKTATTDAMRVQGW